MTSSHQRDLEADELHQRQKRQKREQRRPGLRQNSIFLDHEDPETNSSVFIVWSTSVQDGQGLQQLHVQEVLPSGVQGQLGEGLEGGAKDRSGEEEAG